MAEQQNGAGSGSSVSFPEQSVPRERHRRSDRESAMAGEDNAFALLRLCAGDRDRQAEAAHPGRLMAGAGMPDRRLPVLVPVVADHSSAFPP